jgi:hypothetical protein
MTVKQVRDLRIFGLSTCLTNGVLVGLIGSCFLLISLVAIRDQAPLNSLSLRYWFNSVPTALSWFLGTPHDYTAYYEVGATFCCRSPYQRGPTTIDQLIKETMAVPIQDTNHLWFYKGDDKGLSDIVYLGFRLFGLHSSSIYYVQLLLLGLCTTIGVFLFRFNTRFLLCLLFYFLSLYAMLFTFELSNESTSLVEPRFIGYVSVPAMLFFIFASLNREPLQPVYLVGCSVQALVLMVVIHARSSETWQMVAVCAIAAMCSMSPLLKRDWKMFGRSIFPALVLIIAYGGLAQYKSYMYNNLYFTKYHPTRVIWHNVLMGLAFNENLGPKYRLAKPDAGAVADDGAVIKGVLDFMEGIGEKELANSLFGSKNVFDFEDFNWVVYERYARALYFKILSNDLVEVARTYFQIMPSVFVKLVRFLATDRLLLDRHIFVYSPLAAEARQQRDLYLNPFRAPATVCLIVIAFLTLLSRKLEASLFLLTRRHIGALLLCTALAAVPPLLTVPYLQYAQLFILVLLMWCYVALTSFIYFVCGWKMRVKKRGSSDE